MIPHSLQELLSQQGYSSRPDDKEQIRSTLLGLNIDPESELGIFYLEYDPSFFRSKTSFEQLEDVTVPSVQGSRPTQTDPWKTPVGIATRFIQEVWKVPNNLVALTTTEGEGGYLYDLKSGVVYDFTLSQQSQLIEGTLLPRWNTFYEFLQWYVS